MINLDTFSLQRYATESYAFKLASVFRTDKSYSFGHIRGNEDRTGYDNWKNASDTDIQ